MIKLTFIAMCLSVFMMSCRDNSKTISHSNQFEVQIEKDSSKIEIADLPINIDSTDYLIHPIGYISEYNSRFSSYKNGSDNTSYSVGHYTNFSIKGTFSNIKFQQITSEQLTALTDKIIEITSIHFLEDLRQQTGLQLLVYTIRDMDTNKDAKLNSKDVETLYISNIDGNNFKKLTPNLAQIVDWKLIPQLKRLYFKSISDSNTNGKFDKNDTLIYQYVNLEDKTLTVKNYYPMKHL
ncbi:hypothetical protein [Winogradskyella sp. PC D3.3]